MTPCSCALHALTLIWFDWPEGLGPRFWAVHVTSVFRKWSSTSSQILKITRLQCFHCAATSHSFLDLALIGASSWLGSGRDFDHPPIISVASRSWQHLAQWHKINPQNPQRIATVQPDPTVAEMTQNPKSLRAAFLHVINLTCSRRCCIRHVDGLKFKVYLPTILKKQSLESFCFFFDTETFRNVQRSLLFLPVSDEQEKCLFGGGIRGGRSCRGWGRLSALCLDELCEFQKLDQSQKQHQ